MDEKPWPRRRVEITPGRLLEAIEGRGFSLRKASLDLGYNETYLRNCIQFGWISMKGINKLESKMGILPDEYVRPSDRHLVRMARQAPPPPEPETFVLPEHCKTCIYRGREDNAIGCEYILITGRRRGCRAANCDKYVKGPRANAPKGLILRKLDEDEMIWTDK